MHRQREDSHVWAIATHAGGRVGAAEHRHRQVHHQHVGRQLFRGAAGSFAIGRLANDLDIRLRVQKDLEPFAHHRMVVREHNAE